MDRASVYGTEGCRFESCAVRSSFLTRHVWEKEHKMKMVEITGPDGKKIYVNPMQVLAVVHDHSRGDTQIWLTFPGPDKTPMKIHCQDTAENVQANISSGLSD